MKLTTTTHVPVDGVMQGLGGSDEDRRGGFERGGWALPLFDGDNEATTFLDQVFQRADAFPFGRRTYEIFAGSCNAGGETVRVALFSNRHEFGIVEYPDSDKIGIWGRKDEALDHIIRRSPELDYWDGER